MRPRVLFVGRSRYRLPLEPSLARKWDALERLLELRVLASGSGADPRFVLVPPRRLDGPRFYLELPGRVARELRSFRPDVVVAESPYEGAAVELARRVTGSHARLVVEVHGDWRVSTRLYGARARGLLGPLGDRVSRFALRRADGHRALSGYTAGLLRAAGHEPLAVFPTYSDLGLFTGPVAPPGPEQRVLFVGVLERYKDVEGLARAWRLLARSLPAARLTLVGTGTQSAVAAGLAAAGLGVEWRPRLEPAALAGELDRARALVLPSRSEGLGRVIIEAFLRARPVVATRVGGIPDLVEDGVNGLLVEPGDPAALAGALERLLRDPELGERLGAAAHAGVGRWLGSPADYAEHVAALVADVLGPGASTLHGSTNGRVLGKQAGP